MLFLEGKDGWHRHPFTITSSPQERVMRFAIKALGDETSQLLDVVRPGMPAVIGGPFGRFSHDKGTSRQLWIAGGIGVTPFLSWLRALDNHPLRGRVDFFYTSASANPPYAAEIRALADRHDLVHVHFVNSSSQGHLTAERVLATADAKPGHPLRLHVRPGRHGPQPPNGLPPRRRGQPPHLPRVLRLALSPAAPAELAVRGARADPELAGARSA